MSDVTVEWQFALEAARQRVDAALIDHGTPILIYQMGKVGSATLHHSLRALPELAVFHVHRMEPGHISRARQSYAQLGIELSPDNALGLALHERLCGPDTDGPRTGPPARIVSLVREPLGRNISAFFQNLDRFTGVRDAHVALDVETQGKLFLERFPHDEPQRWFDDEWGPVLGLDPWRYPFDTVRGWQHLQVGRWDLLLLRHDLDDAEKLRLIGEAWGLPGLGPSDPAVLAPKVSNHAADKPYAAAYARFLAEIRLPEAHVDAALSSTYAQQFFPPQERVLLASRWKRGLPSA